MQQPGFVRRFNLGSLSVRLFEEVVGVLNLSILESKCVKMKLKHFTTTKDNYTSIS